MSRKRGEFEHRTSIFEGAYRAWSYLGGLEPKELEYGSVSNFDPTKHRPIKKSHTASLQKNTRTEESSSGNSETNCDFPHEKLPYSGLAHPYIQAILNAWLRQNEDKNSALTTLRTWWQHRRQGQSPSAVAALGTNEVKKRLDWYTNSFFKKAFDIVVNEQGQPPKTLLTKMQERGVPLRKKRRLTNEKINPLAHFNNNKSYSFASSTNAGRSTGDLSTFDRLLTMQRRELEKSGVLVEQEDSNHGSYDVRDSMDSLHLTYHRDCDINSDISSDRSKETNQAQAKSVSTNQANFGGDHANQSGNKQIAMTVHGIKSVCCIKVIETLLRGCKYNQSPIDGVLDAVADLKSSMVLIKMDSKAKPSFVAQEVTQNLSIVGYTAKPMCEHHVNESHGVSTFSNGFEWNAPCTCPDHKFYADVCPRHSQMNKLVLKGFDTTVGMTLSSNDDWEMGRPEEEQALSATDRIAKQPISIFTTYDECHNPQQAASESIEKGGDTALNKPFPSQLQVNAGCSEHHDDPWEPLDFSFS